MNVSVGWLQAWNQAYPGAAQYIQNASAHFAAQPRLTREANPRWHTNPALTASAVRTSSPPSCPPGSRPIRSSTPPYEWSCTPFSTAQCAPRDITEQYREELELVRPRALAAGCRVFDPNCAKPQGWIEAHDGLPFPPGGPRAGVDYAIMCPPSCMIYPDAKPLAPGGEPYCGYRMRYSGAPGTVQYPDPVRVCGGRPCPPEAPNKSGLHPRGWVDPQWGPYDSYQICCPGPAQSSPPPQSNPSALGWAAIGLGAAVVASFGYAAYRSQQAWEACQPDPQLVPEGTWFDEAGNLANGAVDALLSAFSAVVEAFSSEDFDALKLAQAAIDKVAADPERCKIPGVAFGQLAQLKRRVTELAEEWLAVVYGTARSNNPGRIPAGLSPKGARGANQGSIGPALGLSPYVYGQPGPWAPPLALQPHFPANNPLHAVPRSGSPMGRHPGRAASLRSLNPPTTIDWRESGHSAWWPSPEYGTGQYGAQYAPNPAAGPSLPQNAPWVPPEMLVGPTQTIVVGGASRPDEIAFRPSLPHNAPAAHPTHFQSHAPWWQGGVEPYGTGQNGRQYSTERSRFRTLAQRAPEVPDVMVDATGGGVVSVAGQAARLARNLWGSMASCSGGNKTCGKSLDFRDPTSMLQHQARGQNNYRQHPGFQAGHGWTVPQRVRLGYRPYYNPRWTAAQGVS